MKIRKFSSALSILCALATASSMLCSCANSSADDASLTDDISSAEVTTATTSDTTSATSDTATADVTTAPQEQLPVVTLETSPVQTVNEVPATFESLGADKSSFESFKARLMQESSIPIISVTTSPDEQVTSINEYTSCVVNVFNTEDGQEITDASAGIRVRGNSSAYYGNVDEILKNQVPYRIRFDEKTNMLGLNDGARCKSWVLLKADWDLIRNDIALRFGRAILEDDNFCSDAQLVHVYINERFKGIYLLCEQCQINENRVDITPVEEGYTGTDIGYYLELDNYAMSDPDNHYISLDYEGATVTDINGDTRAFVPAEYSVKNDLYSQNQIDFIDSYLNNVFKIIYEACENGNYLTLDESYKLVEADFKNAEETVCAVVDIASVRDMYILYEIVHDYDCGEGSFYMCVDFSANSKCPKLRFTSPWDFNWAYNDSAKQYHACAFTDMSFVNQYGDRSNPWFIVLMKQDWFKQLVCEKWTELSDKQALQGCIEEERQYLLKYTDDLCKTEEWAIACAGDLLSWIFKRIDWLDSQWNIK